MVFKNFRFQLIVRVLLLSGCITVLAWCITQGLYLRSVYLGAAAVILVAELIWFVDSFNRDVKTFIHGLLQRDFTMRFQAERKGKTFHELYGALNQITHLFKTISSEKEVQLRYLEMLVEHLRVGILSYDANEKIHLANQALKKLLQKKILPSLKIVEAIDPDLYSTLRNIRSGETRLVKLVIQNQLLQLSVHASEFRLDNYYYKLISMQDIRTELDNREMEAWQKLIRVLTHEIMNSVSPITSLSATLHGLVKQHEEELTQTRLYTSLERGLDAIRVRSEGLHGFTEAYRKLTRIPLPRIRKCDLREIMQRVRLLVEPAAAEKNIALDITIPEAVVMADPELMEHVFINLIQNATDAVSGKSNARVSIYTTTTPEGRTALHFQDNGPGIDPQMIDKIFIPFFTTKSHGSGIGLAISKQILQLHQAEIEVHNDPGRGCRFTVVM